MYNSATPGCWVPIRRRYNVQKEMFPMWVRAGLDPDPDLDPNLD